MQACGRLGLEIVVLIFVAAQMEGEHSGVLFCIPCDKLPLSPFLKKKKKIKHGKAVSLEKPLLAFSAAYTPELKQSRFGWLRKLERTSHSKDKYLT